MVRDREARSFTLSICIMQMHGPAVQAHAEQALKAALALPDGHSDFVHECTSSWEVKDVLLIVKGLIL